MYDYSNLLHIVSPYLIKSRGWASSESIQADWGRTNRKLAPAGVTEDLCLGWGSTCLRSAIPHPEAAAIINLMRRRGFLGGFHHDNMVYSFLVNAPPCLPVRSEHRRGICSQTVVWWWTRGIDGPLWDALVVEQEHGGVQPWQRDWLLHLIHLWIRVISFFSTRATCLCTASTPTTRISTRKSLHRRSKSPPRELFHHQTYLSLHQCSSHCRENKCSTKQEGGLFLTSVFPFDC